MILPPAFRFLTKMQHLAIAVSCLSLVTCYEDLCGKYKLPNKPVHFDPSHKSQWRLVATEGQKQDGTIIKGVKSETMYPTVIRGHWAIGEIEWYSDAECTKKHPTLIEQGTQLSPLHTTYDGGDDCPYPPHDFHSTLPGDPPWYSEVRAMDSCHSSEFWSACYQCEEGDAWPEVVEKNPDKGPNAWYGVQFHNDENSQVGCVKIFQKDADAYTATKVFLERWMVNETDGSGAWTAHGNWTGLTGGRWFILKNDTTVAIGGTNRGTVPGLLGLITALLLTSCYAA
jgi:hypothetical protein